MNWFQLIAALYVLAWATFLYLCDTASYEQSAWSDL